MMCCKNRRRESVFSPSTKYVTSLFCLLNKILKYFYIFIFSLNSPFLPSKLPSFMASLATTPTTLPALMTSWKIKSNNFIIQLDKLGVEEPADLLDLEPTDIDDFLLKMVKVATVVETNRFRKGIEAMVAAAAGIATTDNLHVAEATAVLDTNTSSGERKEGESTASPTSQYKKVSNNSSLQPPHIETEHCNPLSHLLHSTFIHKNTRSTQDDGQKTNSSKTNGRVAQTKTKKVFIAPTYHCPCTTQAAKEIYPKQKIS